MSDELRTSVKSILDTLKISNTTVKTYMGNFNGYMRKYTKKYGNIPETYYKEYENNVALIEEVYKIASRKNIYVLLKYISLHYSEKDLADKYLNKTIETNKTIRERLMNGKMEKKDKDNYMKLSELKKLPRDNLNEQRKLLVKFLLDIEFTPRSSDYARILYKNADDDTNNIYDYTNGRSILNDYKTFALYGKITYDVPQSFNKYVKKYVDDTNKNTNRTIEDGDLLFVNKNGNSYFDSRFSDYIKSTLRLLTKGKNITSNLLRKIKTDHYTKTESFRKKYKSLADKKKYFNKMFMHSKDVSELYYDKN